MRDEPPSTAFTCDITVLAGDWTGWLASAESIVEEAATAAFGQTPIPPRPNGAAEVSLVLADNETVQRLNREFRGKDAPTNVLSFAGSDADFPEIPDAPVHLGDIVLALETLQAEAAAQGKTGAAHLAHLTVHGLLHLLGYDHERGEADAAAMEALEVRILAHLGIGDPYASEQRSEDAATVGDPA